MAFTREELLATVERSPELVRAHDRAGWIELYTPDAQIDDPVGSRPHRGPAEIDRFYSTFIAPREITFHRGTDLVVEDTVIRDLELEVALSDALTLRIPAVLRYDLAAADSAPRIQRLQAFWELPLMVGQFLRAGPRAVPVGTALTAALLRNQGLAGTGGFLTGLRGAGRAGKREFTRFLADGRAGDEIAVRRRLAKGARITLGETRPLAAAELLERLTLDGAHPRNDKVIAAGRHVVVALDTGGDAGGDTGHGRAVIIGDVEKNPFAVTRIRLFEEIPGG
jgi:hypothetical protein